ncbi:MAG: DUF1674 domain-containing protein [Gammaproteobacteria bacterium]|jgi:hypothetical protein
MNASERETKSSNKAKRVNSLKKAIENSKTKELGGPSGPEPTRYGDWERAGRCIDF